MATIVTQNNKIVTRSGFISCSCCCSFDLADIRIPTENELLRSIGRTCGRSGENPDPEVYSVWPTLPCITYESSGRLGSDQYNSPEAGRYARRPRGCLKFYYRIVNEEASQDGLVLAEQEISSGVISLKMAIEQWLNYRDDKPNLFEGESCGMYIYGVNFWYWSKRQFVGQGQGTDGSNYIKDSVYNVEMFNVIRVGAFLNWPPY